MALNRGNLTELLLERIYDVLWHNDIIPEFMELEHFKDILRADIIIQLDIIERELENGK